MRDCEIELEDSKEKGYLILSRAIQIEWDYGKKTALLTSLPSKVVSASEIVKAYFDRWPNQELHFRVMKSVASLHRVAGYGRQKEDNPKVLEKKEFLQQRISQLKTALSELFDSMANEEKAIFNRIVKERRIKNKSKINLTIRFLLVYNLFYCYFISC